jgi:hypothetical protein
MTCFRSTSWLATWVEANFAPLLWNLRIHQADRSEGAIVFPKPVLLQVGKRFLRGHNLQVEKYTGMVPMYQARPTR